MVVPGRGRGISTKDDHDGGTLPSQKNNIKINESIDIDRLIRNII